jgi:predicted MFS family arabinose efflux permease
MDLQLLRQPPHPRLVSHTDHRAVRVRLSVLMFLLYVIPGAIVPLFTLRLQELGFSPIVMGLCCATQALGTMLAPLLAGQVADRWIAPERCLAACAVTEAVLLWLLGSLTEPVQVFVITLIFWLVMAPSLTLSTSICFASLGEQGKNYGQVRLWGTVGWVVPCWLLGIWLSDADWLHLLRSRGELKDAFRLAALAAVVFGIYVLTLPHTKPMRGGALAAPLYALRQLHGRAFWIYALCTFGVSACLPFSTQVTPLLLSDLNVPTDWLLPTLTIAQASEVASLALLPWLLTRIGVRGTMRLGLIAAALTLTALMVGRPLMISVGGLGLYGLCISCYLVAGQMYLNYRTTADVRASAQALHSVLCGLGQLAGNLLVGIVRQAVNEAFAPTFAVAAGIAVVLFGIFLVGFPARGEDE